MLPEATKTEYMATNTRGYSDRDYQAGGSGRATYQRGWNCLRDVELLGVGDDFIADVADAVTDAVADSDADHVAVSWHGLLTVTWETKPGRYIF